MGRRPGHPEGAWPRLKTEKLVDRIDPSGKLALELVNRRRIGNAPAILLSGNRLEPRRSGACHFGRTPVETALRRRAGSRPAKRQPRLAIAVRHILARDLLDASERVANAGKPGDGFGIGAGSSRGCDSGRKWIIPLRARRR